VPAVYALDYYFGASNSVFFEEMFAQTIQNYAKKSKVTFEGVVRYE